MVILPQEKQGNDGMEEDSTSPIQGNNSPPSSTSSIAPAVEKITPLAPVSEHTNQRYFSDVMDKEEEDKSNTPKNKRLEEPRKLVQAVGDKGKKKQVKVTGPAFESNFS